MLDIQLLSKAKAYYAKLARKFHCDCLVRAKLLHDDSRYILTRFLRGVAVLWSRFSLPIAQIAVDILLDQQR